MSKTAIIFTGGTIASRSNFNSKVKQPAIKGQDLLDGIPEIREIFNPVINDFGNYPSSEMDPRKLLRLYRLIKEYAQRPDINGIVVTHGTDTMEEAACFMDSLYRFSKPLVFVGAMRSFDDPGYDGYANLLDAVRVAAHPQAAGLGVMVVMNGQIHAARDVVKAHSSDLNAFQSPDTGALGRISGGNVYFYRLLRRLPVMQQPLKISRKVGLLKSYSGMSPDTVTFFVKSGYSGLVVEAMGMGNLPAAVVRALTTALEGGLTVVICSRCCGGRIGSQYGSVARLQAAGAVPGGRWSGTKARIRLLLALNSEENNTSVIKALFAQD